jgi:SAM-dependent methyltransferase
MEAGSMVGRPDVQTDRPGDRRAHLHGMWAAVAGGWAEHADYADARTVSLTEGMLAVTAPQPGARVLELACGPGGTGLAAAGRVGAEGQVVLSDVVAGMVAIAERRAAALGLSNVRARVLDLEAIDEPDASYDVVLCREGLMFAVDPAAALREVRRVLRPGGRTAITVWGPRERNPWLGVLFDAVAAQLGRPIPPPGMPSPFALQDAGRLTALLRDAGLADVAVAEVEVPLRAGSFEEWWTRTSSLAGPLTAVLASMPEAARSSLTARLRETTSAYATAEGMDFPGVALLASGMRDR